MKFIFTLISFLLPLSAMAQSVWEKPVSTEELERQKAEAEKRETPSEDAKYLAGAVPEVDGKVQWTMDVDVPGKTADQIYDIILQCFTDLTKTENQLEGSQVALVNRKDHIVVAAIREWLVFTDKLFMLDRTKFHYTLIAYCKDNHLTVTMGRITYRYEEDRTRDGGYVYKAEEWINDKNALNRKQTKLLRGSAKFRRHTIDRKDYLFGVIKDTVLK